MMARISDPLLQQVRAYWEALRDGPMPPFRSQIEARGIEAALSHAFMLHRTDALTAVMRAPGRGITALVGGEPSGRALSVLFGANWQLRAAELVEAMFAGPSILHLDLTAEDAMGGRRLSGALQILPLRDADGRTTDAVGCLVLADDALPRPTLFAIGHSQILPLAPRGTALVPMPADRAGALPGFADPAAPFARPAKDKHPYLRLVHSRD